MESDKFQEFMGDQFAKMFQEMQKVSGELQKLRHAVQGVKDIQLRMENDLNIKLAKVYEFMDTQTVINKAIIQRLDRIELKLPKQKQGE
jgi:hypothetical protein